MNDLNFYVMVIDFESWDIDMEKVFNIIFFCDRYIFVKMMGKFYKIFVLNEGVVCVLSEYDLVFFFDFYIDVFVDIIDSVRKVNNCNF